MEKKNNKGLIVGLFIGIIISVIVVSGLFATGIIVFETKTNNNQEKNIINDVTFNNEKISISDISQETIYISSEGTESLNSIYNYYVDLYSFGKVRIETIGMGNQNSGEHSKEFISNVDGVVDIIQFNVAGIPEEQLIYMLLNNGDVYYYRVGDSINKKYIATKVETVSHVKKLFIYNYPNENNGDGSWSIVAIKDNNETVALNTASL